MGVGGEGKRGEGEEKKEEGEVGRTYYHGSRSASAGCDTACGTAAGAAALGWGGGCGVGWGRVGLGLAGSSGDSCSHSQESDGREGEGRSEMHFCCYDFNKEDRLLNE